MTVTAGQRMMKKVSGKMEHNKIIPTKPLPNDKLRKEIENFKFFVQYGDFKDINDYKDGDISYNLMFQVIPQNIN